MKRKLILIVFVLAVCLLIPYANITDLAISLEAPDRVMAGDNIELDLSITDNPGIVGMTFKIEYNENLKLESYQVGDVLALPVEPTSLSSQTLFYFDVGESLQQSAATGRLIKFTFSTSETEKAETAVINIIEIEAVNESDQIVNLSSQGRIINISVEANEQPAEIEAPSNPYGDSVIVYPEYTEAPKVVESGSSTVDNSIATTSVPQVTEPQIIEAQTTVEPSTEKPIVTQKPVITVSNNTLTGEQSSSHQNHFTDISANNWYFADVNWCYQNKLMNGTSENIFSAEQPMTRAMLVTVLYRLADQPKVLTQNLFNDVGASDYYNKAVNWAVQNGIITGYNSDVFGADDNVTRQQIATIMYRYSKAAGLPIANLNDKSANYNDAKQISDYAKDGLNYCIQQGIMTGRPGNLLDPQNKATRAEVATMLRRFAKVVKPSVK